MKQLKLLVATLAMGVSMSANAETGWIGQGEAGINFASGNSESENANIGLNFANIGKIYENEFGFDYIKSSNDDVDSAESLAAKYRLKRKLSERHYLFGLASYLDDDFDGFTEQVSVAAGYGYKLFTPDPLAWDIGIGVGYRDTSELFIQEDGSELEGEDVSGATLVLFSDYTFKISKSTDFVNKFIAEIGSDNTYIESDSALVVGINNAFALKLGVLVRHNTDPAEGADDTDTFTSANLVYNFK